MQLTYAVHEEVEMDTGGIAVVLVSKEETGYRYKIQWPDRSETMVGLTRGMGLAKEFAMVVAKRGYVTQGEPK